MSKFREHFCKENNIELSDLIPNKPIFKFYSYWLENKLEEQLRIGGVVSSCVDKELLIAELDDKRCIGVEMNEDMWYLCRKETAQHLLDNYKIIPK